MSPSSSIRDFAQYAGRFLWPRTIADLTDTTSCPACRTPLPSPVCPSCGLDLRHPAARDLLIASTDAAAALEKRVRLIGQIRYEVAAAQETAAAQAKQHALDARADAAAAEAADRAARAASDRATALASAPPAPTTVSAPPALDAPAAPAPWTSPTETAATTPGTPGTTPPELPPFAAPGYRPPLSTAPVDSDPTAPDPVPTATHAPATPTPKFNPTAANPAPARPAEPTSAPRPATPARAATPPPTDDTKPGEPAAPKRSSVQIVLLLVGVTLVSIAAIFFLTVAFIVTGLAFRAIVVAALTLGTLVTAVLLRRKGLVATAEGIGALAVVLVLLDFWAARELNLFGLAGGDGLLYWGGALAACTGLFLAWHAVSSLRVASVAGFAAAAPAVGLLAAGIAADAAPLTRTFLAVTGAAAGALLHRFTLPGSAGRWPSLDRRPERIALLSIAGLGLITATALAGAVNPGVEWSPLGTFGAVAVVATAHALLVLNRPAPDAALRVAGYASVALAVLAGLLGVIVSTVRTDNVDLMMSVPLVSAVFVVLAFEVAWRRQEKGPVRRAILVGALTALCLTLLSGFVAAVAASVPLLRALIGSDSDPIARVSGPSAAALGALVVAGVLVAGVWRQSGVFTARRHGLAWFGLAVLLLAVPFAQWLWLILPLYLLIGAAALAALFRARSRPALAAFRPELIAVFAAAETLGYLLGWSSSSSWWVGTVSAVAALVLARYLLDPAARGQLRGALLSVAIVLALIGAAAAPAALTRAAPPSGGVLLVHVLLLVALATATLQLLTARGRLARFSPTESRWAFWTLLAPTVASIGSPTALLLDDLSATERATVPALTPALGILAAVLLVAATLLWTLAAAPRLRWERLVAALLVGPALLALAIDLVLLTDAPPTVSVLAAPIAALLTAALALALRVTGRRSRTGLGLEAGAFIVLATGFFPLDRPELGWLVLLFTAVTVLLTAVDADGLFASNSWRRHVGWFSLLLATLALWWGLADSGTTPIEAYTLPVAGTVLALAALLWRFGRVDRTVTASPGAALLTFAGLCLALLPLAITGQTGALARPLLVAGAAAVLLVGAALLRWTTPRWAFLAAAGLAGGAALLVAGVARSIRVLTATEPAGALLEAWLLPTTVVLIAAAVLLVRQDHEPTRSIRHLSALALVLIALITLTALETAAFDAPRLGEGRAVGLILLLGILHVLALYRPRAPFGAVTGWSTIALAGGATVTALLIDAVDPFEAVLVPLGAALAAGQLLRNRPWSAGAGRSAFASHYWIGAGLTLALLPSAIVAATPGAGTLTAAGLTDDAVRQLVTVLAGGALTVTGAVLLVRPRWGLLAWPAVLVGAVAVVITAAGRVSALLDTSQAGPDWRLEAWLLPAALLIIGAGALIIRSFPPAPAGAAPSASMPAAPASASASAAPAPQPTAADRGARVPDADRAPARALGYGLVTLALLGILGAESAALSYSPYATGRVLALIALFAVLHVALRWADQSRAGTLLAWFSIAAGALSLVAGLGRDLIDPIELGTGPLGLSLVAGQLLASRAPERADAASPDRLWPRLWIGSGFALALLPSALEGWNGDPLRPVLTLVAGGVLALGGARLLTHPRRDSLAWPGVIVGAAAIVLSAAGRIQPLLETTPTGPDGRLEAWLVPAALLLIGAGATVITGAPELDPVPAPAGSASAVGPASATASNPRRVLGYGLVIVALTGILAAESGALPFAPYADGRLIGLIILFALLHVAVRWFDRTSAGTALAWVAAAAGLVALIQGWRLDRPDPLELGTIPLGVALVVGQLIHVGLLGGRANQPGATDARTLATGLANSQIVLGAGLALAVLPSVVAGADGSPVRPVLVLALGGALGVLGALLRSRVSWVILAWPACVVGVAAVLGSAGFRIMPLFDGPTGPTGQLEAWLIPAALLLVLIGAALVWTTWAEAPRTSAPMRGNGAAASVTGAAEPMATGAARIDRSVWAGYGLVIVALVGVVLAEVPALDYAPLASVRVVLVVWLFAALYLGVFWADESRPGRLVAWVAIGGAVVMVLAGWTRDVPDPVEVVSVPVALALVAAGLLHLDRAPAARSWLTLGPGLAVLLLPSLFLDLTYSPLWRVVGLGLLAIAVLLLGTVRKLQAPFLIGAVVLLVHGVAQLWPWISLAYGAVPWWLWLGVGGVLLIVLAARYEQRIQNLKSVALRISSLR
jgi:hypothetical protein